MSQSTISAPKPGMLARLRDGAAENPIWALIGVLVILYAATGIIEPNYVSLAGVRNTLLQAAPLGILAGAQTVLMLTGG
ncbi:MAG: hypothetical protein KDE01_08835, partial [Caldilineaceae bacterium]|nr:hypothetical protein [Caldilineaceae bacterium]